MRLREVLRELQTKRGWWDGWQTIRIRGAGVRGILFLKQKEIRLFSTEINQRETSGKGDASLLSLRSETQFRGDAVG